MSKHCYCIHDMGQTLSHLSDRLQNTDIVCNIITGINTLVLRKLWFSIHCCKFTSLSWHNFNFLLDLCLFYTKLLKLSFVPNWNWVGVASLGVKLTLLMPHNKIVLLTKVLSHLGKSSLYAQWNINNFQTEHYATHIWYTYFYDYDIWFIFTVL